MAARAKNRNSCDLVVIGASAGGVDALRRLVSHLPRNLPAAVCVVLHLGEKKSFLPEILSRSGPLLASHAEDYETINKRHIYIAPPNFHMLIKPGYFRVIMGPKENYFRPAINPLFRTAAAAYRERVAGVILSGSLEDGAVGLKAIKHHGGMAVVQDPKEAAVPDMPMNAIRKDEIDYVMSLSEIADFITRVSNNGKASGEMKIPDIKIERDILELPMKEIEKTIMEGEPTELTCPECGGAIWEQSQEGLIQFRCHVGHTYSAGIMKEAKAQNAEASMWNVIRTLEEKESLLRRMAGNLKKMETGTSEKELLDEAKKSKEYASQIRNLLYEAEEGRNTSRAKGGMYKNRKKEKTERP